MSAYFKWYEYVHDDKETKNKYKRKYGISMPQDNDQMRENLRITTTH